MYVWLDFAHSAAGSRYQYIVAVLHQYEPDTVYQLRINTSRDSTMRIKTKKL